MQGVHSGGEEVSVLSPRSSLTRSQWPSSPSAQHRSSAAASAPPLSPTGLPSASSSSSSSLVARERDFVVREERKLKGVQLAMVQCAQLTEQMVDLLDALDAKLNSLHTSMTPVHRGTEGLIQAQKSPRFTSAALRPPPRPPLCCPPSSPSLPHSLSPSVSSCLRCVSPDLDLTLSETERVISYVAVATEFDEESTVSSSSLLPPSSPSNSASSPLSPLSVRHISTSPSAFLSWLQSVTAALTYFTQQSQMVHSALYCRRLRELQRRGVAECAAEFERLMAQHSRPLDVARLQWPLSGEVELMPPSILSLLASIAGGMSDCGVTAPFTACLVRERSAAMRATLKKVIKDEGLNPLRDAEEAKAASGAEVPQALESRGGGREEEESRSSLSGSRAPSSASMAPSTPQHSTGAGVASSGGPQLLNSQKAAALTSKEREKAEERRRLELYKKGTHAVIFHVDFLLALLQPERRLLSRLLLPTSLSEEENAEHFNRLFADVCKESLAYLIRKVRNWGKVEYRQENRILALLDISAHCSRSVAQLRAVFPWPESTAPFAEFTGLVLSTLRRQLSEYSVYIAQFDEERQGGRKKAKDGSVAVLTIEVLQLLRRLGDYREVLEGMNRAALLPEAAESQLPGAREKAERERQAREKREREEAAELERSRAKGKGVSAQQLEGQQQRERERQRRSAREELKVSSLSSVYASLALHLLLTLDQHLEQRAKQLKSPSLAAVFLLNNHHYTAAFLQRHRLHLDQLHHYHHMAAQHSVADYRLHTWGPTLALLPSAAEADGLAAQLAAEQSGGGEKAKKAIKGVFAGFNGQLEEVYATQRLFSVTDPALRAELRQGNAQLLLPRYGPVWEKLSGLPFTTKQTKYCKFPPHVVDSMLARLFDEQS